MSTKSNKKKANKALAQATFTSPDSRKISVVFDCNNRDAVRKLAAESNRLLREGWTSSVAPLVQALCITSVVATFVHVSALLCSKKPSKTIQSQVKKSKENCRKSINKIKSAFNADGRK